MLFKLPYDFGAIEVEELTTIAEQEYQDQIGITFAALFGTPGNTF